MVKWAYPYLFKTLGQTSPKSAGLSSFSDVKLATNCDMPHFRAYPNADSNQDPTKNKMEWISDLFFSGHWYHGIFGYSSKNGIGIDIHPRYLGQ